MILIRAPNLSLIHLVIINESLKGLLSSREFKSNFIKQKIHEVEDINILIDYDNNPVNKNLVRLCIKVKLIDIAEDIKILY